MNSSLQKKRAMKKLFLIIITILVSIITINAQSPQKFQYQTIVRDNQGKEISNQIISIRIAIVKNNPSGFEVYSETHTETTNDFGLVNLQVGSGIVISGDISNIDWGNDKYFLKVENDD